MENQNNKIHNGYTIWARQTFNSDIFFYKPDKWFKIWFFIVNKVNHTENGKFGRGEGLITYEEIMTATRATKAQVHKFMKWAVKENMIDNKRTTRGEIRKVLKYADFQDSKNYKTTTETTTETTDGQLTDNSGNLPINKNDNNNKNERREEGGSAAIAAPTPREISERFFTKGSGLQIKAVDFLSEKGMNRDEATREIAKFVNHWTEASPSGKKLKWQMEKTFEVKKRLATWIGNFDKWNQRGIQAKTFRERDEENARRQAREEMGLS